MDKWILDTRQSPVLQPGICEGQELKVWHLPLLRPLPIWQDSYGETPDLWIPKAMDYMDSQLGSNPALPDYLVWSSGSGLSLLQSLPSLWARICHLPCLAVGESTASKLRAVGLNVQVIGQGNLKSLCAEFQEFLRALGQDFGMAPRLKLWHFCSVETRLKVLDWQEFGFEVKNIPIYAPGPNPSFVENWLNQSTKVQSLVGICYFSGSAVDAAHKIWSQNQGILPPLNQWKHWACGETATSAMQKYQWPQWTSCRMDGPIEAWDHMSQTT
jgi:uroporphyrinogen-III synthase